MSKPIIYLDNQYQHIEKAIKASEISLDELFDIYGEQLNHYLLLSELIKVLSCSSIDVSTVGLVVSIVHFELIQFKPFGYLAQPFEDKNVFLGEILYANDYLALCRIDSVKYNSLSVIITITKETKSLKFPFRFNRSHYDFKINGVI